MDRTLELVMKAKEGDEEAKAQLVEENAGLVYSVAKRFLNRGYNLDDLYQIGCIGLIKCINNFDVSYEVRFSTYAVPMIMGEIKRFLRDDGMVKVSRSLKEIAYKVKMEREKILGEKGKEPSIEEISAALEINREDIIAALEANSEVESIYKTLYQNDGNTIYLADKLMDAKDEHGVMVENLALHEVIEQLPEKEKELIRLRYFEEQTQSQIAKKLGISQVQVSRMEKKILFRLRGKLS